MQVPPKTRYVKLTAGLVLQEPMCQATECDQAGQFGVRETPFFVCSERCLDTLQSEYDDVDRSSGGSSSSSSSSVLAYPDGAHNTGRHEQAPLACVASELDTFRPRNPVTGFPRPPKGVTDLFGTTRLYNEYDFAQQIIAVGQGLIASPTATQNSLQDVSDAVKARLADEERDAYAAFRRTALERAKQTERTSYAFRWKLVATPRALMSAELAQSLVDTFRVWNSGQRGLALQHIANVWTRVRGTLGRNTTPIFERIFGAPSSALGAPAAAAAATTTTTVAMEVDDTPTATHDSLEHVLFGPGVTPLLPAKASALARAYNLACKA